MEHNCSKMTMASREATVPLPRVATNITNATNYVQLTSTGTLKTTTVFQALRSYTKNKVVSRQKLTNAI